MTSKWLRIDFRSNSYFLFGQFDVAKLPTTNKIAKPLDWKEHLFYCYKLLSVAFYFCKQQGALLCLKLSQEWASLDSSLDAYEPAGQFPHFGIDASDALWCQKAIDSRRQFTISQIKSVMRIVFPCLSSSNSYYGLPPCWRGGTRWWGPVPFRRFNWARIEFQGPREVKKVGFGKNQIN
jgi:hypothetical protein